MKKSIVVLLHLGFWGCYFILIMVMLGMYFRGEEQMEARIANAMQIIMFFALIPAAITFYSFYLLLFPRYFKQNRFVPAILYGSLISLGAAAVGFAFLNIIFGAECLGEESLQSNIELVFFMAFIAMIAGVVALVIKGFITWFEEVKLKEALVQKNHEMELALVKSQLDPHFLFNTLNNIDILILKNANEASNYLNKLSDIMRFMLFETKTNEILLCKEIEYIEKYIALQKIRTANSNYIHFEVSGTPDGKTIAPMVFIPFIENAFKHTTNKKLEEAIRIRILINQQSIQLECINKLDASRQSNQESNGLGNELIQKRLNLIYPQRHHLEVSHQSDRYSVNLSIDHE